MGFFIVLPVLGGVFALMALRRVTPLDRDIAAARLKFAFPLSAIIIVPMSSVVFAATRVVSSLGFWGAGHALSAASPIVCLLLTAVFLMLSYFTLVKVDSRLLLRFMPALLVLFALYTPVYAGLGESAGLSSTGVSLVFQYAELYGHAFVWSVILLAVRTLRMPALRVMGIQFSLFVVMELLLQRFLLAYGQGSLAIVLFAFFVALALLVWALCHFDGQAESRVGSHCAAMGGMGAGEAAQICAVGGREASAPRSAKDGGHDSSMRASTTVSAPTVAFQPDPGTSTCDSRLAMAAAHGLTPRETDVFLLLAQGRSRRFICDELFIADGTASTYISRVYDKFGVHSKQELLTAVLEGEST